MLFCLFWGIQPNAIASELLAKPDLLSSIEGYHRLEMALDKYLMEIPSGYYAIANIEELKSLMDDHQALLVDDQRSLVVQYLFAYYRSIDIKFIGDRYTCC